MVVVHKRGSRQLAVSNTSGHGRRSGCGLLRACEGRCARNRAMAHHCCGGPLDVPPLGDRERLYDRITTLKPVPAGVSREQTLKLDPVTLQRWKKESAWQGELGRKSRGCASNGS